MEEKWNAGDAVAREGVDAAAAPCAADQRNRSLGQESLPEDQRGHVARVRAAKGRELSVWIEFKTFSPVKTGVPSKAAVDPRRVPMWKMPGGKRDREARLVARGYHEADKRCSLVGTRAARTFGPRIFGWRH